MNPRFTTPHPFRAVLLALALLFAQLELVVHHMDLAAHGTAGACEFCLTHADLTDASPQVSLPPPVVPAASDEPVFFPAAFAAPHHPSYSARAPPPSAS